MENELSDLRRLQLVELDMLKEFAFLCQNLNLTYYAVGGTLLGAVRHKGCIPWDDMDIGMPREDCEKFVAQAPSLLPKNLKLIPNPLNLNILQLVNLDTKVNLSGIESGIFIDIFPLDGVPEGRLKRFFFDKRVLLNRMLCKLSVLDILEERDRGLMVVRN